MGNEVEETKKQDKRMNGLWEVRTGDDGDDGDDDDLRTVPRIIQSINQPIGLNIIFLS